MADVIFPVAGGAFKRLADQGVGPDGRQTHAEVVSASVTLDPSLIGATDETAPATDTASSGLNGRLQRLAQRATSLIGLVPASLGQKAKATSLAVTLASDEDLLLRFGEVQASPTANTVLDRLKALLTGIVLSASSAIIGRVGIDQTTPGTTDHVTGSGFTAPVGGAAMNMRTSITYASGQIIAQSTTAGSCSAIPVAVARTNDKTGMLRRLRFKSTDTVNLAGKTIRVHVFKDNPTFTNGDGGNFSGGLSESNYLGYFDITLDQTFSDYVKGIAAPTQGYEINFEPSSGTQNVFLVYEARSAFTSAGTTKTLTPVFEVLQN